MAAVDGLYPFATLDGTAIPLEVIRPYGSIKKSFTSSSSTSAMTVPASVETLAVMADKDCIIQFAASGAVASAYSDGVMKVDAVFIPMDMLLIISPPFGMKSFAVIGDTEAGTIRLQFIQPWSGLATVANTTRR